jgi:hypothetical protein
MLDVEDVEDVEDVKDVENVEDVEDEGSDKTNGERSLNEKDNDKNSDILLSKVGDVASDILDSSGSSEE